MGQSTLSLSAPYFSKFATSGPHISTPPSRKTEIIVTIPCYQEPDIIPSLESLKNCLPATGSAEVILLINASAKDSQPVHNQNQQTYTQVAEWYRNQARLPFTLFTLVFNDLPPKHAGVGLARKLAMDEAARRFASLGKDGIIACFDADSTCAPNYLQALQDLFNNNPACRGCSIYFEHALSSITDAHIRHGIACYELHLRYYVQALRYAGFPHAFHTIGSSMAVKASAYVAQGGMNRRKAGEDFYFLHKVIPEGDYQDLTQTTVYPSPRSSHRVPFGTGKAMHNWETGSINRFVSYNPDTFEELKQFFSIVPDLYRYYPDIPAIPGKALPHYLEQENFDQELEKMVRHSNTPNQFLKHFFTWFNGFRTMKMVHFAREYTYPDQPVEKAAATMFKRIMLTDNTYEEAETLLQKYRELDKNPANISR